MKLILLLTTLLGFLGLISCNSTVAYPETTPTISHFSAQDTVVIGDSLSFSAIFTDTTPLSSYKTRLMMTDSTVIADSMAIQDTLVAFKKITVFSFDKEFPTAYVQNKILIDSTQYKQFDSIMGKKYPVCPGEYMLYLTCMNYAGVETTDSLPVILVNSIKW